jgi:hypothetical protein
MVVVAVAAFAVPVAQADNWGVSAQGNGSRVSVRPDERATGPRSGPLRLAVRLGRCRYRCRNALAAMMLLAGIALGMHKHRGSPTPVAP